MDGNTPTPMQIDALSLPKAGNRPEEYEDAWDYDLASGRLVVADGASDGFESRCWAEALTTAYLSTPPEPQPSAILTWLAEPIAHWQASIAWERLPWYAAAKAERGAFATLLGVTVIPGSDSGTATQTWQALAIGDACLFQIRADALIAAFPLTDPESFGNTPALLATDHAYSEKSLAALQVSEGQVLPGDLLLLTTDALAAWFLRAAAAGERPWEALVDATAEEFTVLIDKLRGAGRLHNDDVTLVRARIIAEPEVAAAPAVGE